MAATSRTERTFDGHYSTSGAIRAAVAAHLAEADVDRATIDDALLVLSELFDNAVRYGDDNRPVVVVGFDPSGEDPTLHISVTNRGDVARVPSRSEWLPADPLALSGRGLSIVDAIATTVTVDGDRGQTTIRAELDVS